MKLAVNYSPQAENLLLEGKIEVDVWKCPSFEYLFPGADKHRPAYVHFDLGTALHRLRIVDWVDSTKSSHLKRVADFVVKELEPVIARFGACKVIVENIVYRGHLGTRKDPSMVTLRAVTDSFDVQSDLQRRTACPAGHAVRRWQALHYYQASPDYPIRSLERIETYFDASARTARISCVADSISFRTGICLE